MTSLAGCSLRAKALQEQGRLHDAIAALSEGITAIKTEGLAENGSNGPNGCKDAETAIQSLLQALREDPFLALALPYNADESEFRKSYRKLALSYVSRTVCVFFGVTDVGDVAATFVLPVSTRTRIRTRPLYFKSYNQRMTCCAIP